MSSYKNNSKIMVGEVSFITEEYCNLIENGKHNVYKKNIELLDGESFTVYSTLFCCKEEDRDKAFNEIDSFNGKRKEDYKINNKYCHIATYKKVDDGYYISFDNDEECGIHANYNKEYKMIENFFINFINFRKYLIDNNMIVKDDDLYQSFLSSVKGFDESNSVMFFDKILQKLKRRN